MPRRRKQVSFFDVEQGGKQWRPKALISEGVASAADDAAADRPAVAGLDDRDENREHNSNSSRTHSALGDSIVNTADSDDDNDNHRSRGGDEDGPAERYIRTKDVRGDIVPANAFFARQSHRS